MYDCSLNSFIFSVPSEAHHSPSFFEAHHCHSPTDAHHCSFSTITVFQKAYHFPAYHCLSYHKLWEEHRSAAQRSSGVAVCEVDFLMN